MSCMEICLGLYTRLLSVDDIQKQRVSHLYRLCFLSTFRLHEGPKAFLFNSLCSLLAQACVLISRRNYTKAEVLKVSAAFTFTECCSNRQPAAAFLKNLHSEVVPCESCPLEDDTVANRVLFELKDPCPCPLLSSTSKFFASAKLPRRQIQLCKPLLSFPLTQNGIMQELLSWEEWSCCWQSAV